MCIVFVFCFLGGGEEVGKICRCIKDIELDAMKKHKCVNDFTGKGEFILQG